MFTRCSQSDAFEVMTGTLDDPERFVKVVDIQCVQTTVDGGFSAWLPTVGAKFLPRWSRTRDESDLLPLEWPCPLEKGHHPKEPSVLAHCNCKGVSFDITRPDAKSGDFKASLPDTVTGYVDGEEPLPSAEKWWLPCDGRYVAGTCACTSCRLASGMDIVQVKDIHRLLARLSHTDN